MSLLPDYPSPSPLACLIDERGKPRPVGNTSAWEPKGLVLGFVLPQGDISFPFLSPECLICKMGTAAVQPIPRVVWEQVVSFFEGAF